MDNTEYKVYNLFYSEYKYGITATTANDILRGILDGTITNWWIDQLFQSTSEYLVKLTYYPVNIPVYFSSVFDGVTIKLGKTATSSSGCILNGGLPYCELTKFYVSTITKFGNFLDYSPHTKITLHVPYFEPIELAPEIVFKMYLVVVYMSIDLNSGKSTLYVEGILDPNNTSRIILATQSIQLGVDIAIGKSNKEEQTRNNALQAISVIGSLTGLAIGAKSGNPLITAGSIGSLTKQTKEFASNNIDRLTSYKGASGDRTALLCDKRVYLLIERPKDVIFPDASLKGKMCCKNLALSNLKNTGYAEIGKINFNPSGSNITDDEINEIIDTLRSGVIL